VTSETVADAGRKEQITSGTLFDWAAIITLLWTMFGAGVDAWAHWHGATDSTFFTPWHAVLYSGVVAAAIVHFGTVCFNVGRGYPLSEAIPPGYQYAMLGLGVALIGGGLDLVWHTLFGVEANIEALLSPTHAILVIGFVLVFSGPFRALWERMPRGAKVNWRQGFPAVMSLTIVTMLLTAYFDYLSPWSGAWASNRYAAIPVLTGPDPFVWSPSEFAIALGVSATIVSGAFLVGLVLFVNRQLCLPLGSWTLILVLSTAIAETFRDEFRLVPVAFVGGLLFDLVARYVLKPGVWLAKYAYAFAMPVVLFTAYYVALFLTGGVWWSAHVVVGSVVMAGGGGLIIAYLLKPRYEQPREPLQELL